MRKLKLKKNRGFTYVELIVVLSIFAIMTSIVIFNYGAYQAKVDIKVLANDIALQIVQAQKDAMSGKLNTSAALLNIPGWKPSYGVYFFDPGGGHDKDFIYFTDLNKRGFYDVNNIYSISDCSNVGTSGNECLKDITLTKGNYIVSLQPYDTSDAKLPSIKDLSITFIRPNSEAYFYSCGSSSCFSLNDPSSYPQNFSYVQITVASPQSSTIKSCIQVYTSGRVQIGQCQP